MRDIGLRKVGIYEIADKDRDDVGWTLPIPLTTAVEPSTKVTVCKEDDNFKEENILVFLSDVPELMT